MDTEDQKKAAVSVGKTDTCSVEHVVAVPKERAQFRALMLVNPNYFGNLKESPFPPVVAIQGNTIYEEIGCVGFQPQFNRLDAVVYVKQPSGYGGDICSAGTPEYVRFYLSFDNGATWVDQGMTSFTAYDIPAGTIGEKRLEYAVSLPISPPQKLCKLSNIILARAILSWNDAPPPDTPDFPPVWGEVHNTYILVDPLKLPNLIDIFDGFKLKVPVELPKLINLDQPVQTTAKALNVAELHALYKDKGVEPHRYALAEVKKLIAQPQLTAAFKAPGFKGAFAGLDIDLGDIIGKLFPTDGSTYYEELECVGLNPNANELIATIRVKRPNGYSGGLCTDGSREYVTFWADFNNNGTFETCLGTASVKVFDIQDIPSDGLEYAVFLPVDLNSHRQPCEAGPRIVPIRAILSWNDIPPCANPNYVPVWGNREETLIHISPGIHVEPGDYSPFLYDISGAGVCAINQSTGLAVGDRPFGGWLYITGEIPAALALNAPDTLKYKVYVRELPSVGPAGPWQALANSFGVWITEGVGLGAAIGYALTQSIDPDGFYTYREYGTPVAGAWRRVSSLNRLLAAWNTTHPMTGMWEIKVEAKDTLTNTIYAAGVTTCVASGTTRQNVKVWLDEVVPTPSVAITGFSVGGGAVQPATGCDDFTQGVTIHGTYSVADEHFSYLTLTVQPADAANGATTDPSSRVYGAPDFVPTTGEAGTWTLDTSAMDPCGFVIRLYTRDRTIVSGGHGWENEDFVGFCLRAPKK